ncbi:hypothetical protein P3T19_007407, partial [Paraburkholderia sp. GAS205]|uniref:hypothetical protein n=1 Tax=Paraburkholderia sp. GAS205 TaxID=3035127 RepID=UPI003D24F8B9
MFEQALSASARQIAIDVLRFFIVQSNRKWLAAVHIKPTCDTSGVSPLFCFPAFRLMTYSHAGAARFGSSDAPSSMLLIWIFHKCLRNGCVTSMRSCQMFGSLSTSMLHRLTLVEPGVLRLVAVGNQAPRHIGMVLAHPKQRVES